MQQEQVSRTELNNPNARRGKKKSRGLTNILGIDEFMDHGPTNLKDLYGLSVGLGTLDPLRDHYRVKYSTKEPCCGEYDKFIDIVSENPKDPLLLLGVYSMAGNEEFVLNCLKNYPEFYHEEEGKYASQSNPAQPTTTFTVYVVGKKTQEIGKCCYWLTLILGFLMILPFFCMCCQFWKQLVYPCYQVSIQTYKAILAFLQANPTINEFQLEVADNAFNREKANLFAEFFTTHKFQRFKFRNQAHSFDYKEFQYTEFPIYTQKLKKIPEKCYLYWDNHRLVH